MHEERTNKHATTDATPEGALPTYLLDREGVSRSKILSNTVKQKRKEKAGKWTVPVPKVNPIADSEMFRVLSTGKRKQNQWKRVITKATASRASRQSTSVSFVQRVCVTRRRT